MSLFICKYKNYVKIYNYIKCQKIKKQEDHLNIKMKKKGKKHIICKFYNIKKEFKNKEFYMMN